MAGPAPGKKRKAPSNAAVAETPKRARKTPLKSPNHGSSTLHDEPNSAATDRTYITAQSSSDVDETAFVTPKTPGIRKADRLDNSTKSPTATKRANLATPSQSTPNRDSDQTPTDVSRQSRKEAKKARRAARRAANGDADESKRRQSHSDVKSSEVKKSKKLSNTRSEVTRHTITVRESVSGSWTLSPPSGGTILDLDPIFVVNDDDEECLVVATSTEVQLLSVETSLIIATLSAPVGLQVQALAASTSDTGVVHVLYSDSSVDSWDLKSKPSMRYQPESGSRMTNAIAVGTFTGSDQDTIFSLAESRKNYGIYIDDTCIFSTKARLTGIRVTASCEYIIAFGRSTIALGRKRNTQTTPQSSVPEYAWVEVPVGNSLISLDIRQAPGPGKAGKASLSLVLGMGDGQLHLFDDISALFSKPAQNDLPTPRILHWHRDAVLSVKFSADGNYLVSGGSETVLVLWQLSTGNKQYLPHLTSAIEHIVVNTDGDRYAISMGDNSVMVLSTSELKPVANMAGLQLAGSAFVGMPVPAVLNPRDETTLLMVVPSTQPNPLLKTDVLSRPLLQTYDVRNMRHVTRQALTRNNATDFNLGPDNTPIKAPDVAHLQISSDGQWLATIDEWTPPISDIQPLMPQDGPVLASERLTRLETYLKMWRWDAEQGLWTLTTRFDAPHASPKAFWTGALPVCIVTDPSAVGFASLGQDDRVRVWRPKSRLRNGVVMKSNTDAELVEWSCKNTIELPLAARRADTPNEANEAQDSSNACLAWSEDGSMLVAAQSFRDADSAPILHFIDASTGSLISKAAVAPEGLIAMAFLDRYLITLGSGHVNLWDIVEDKLSYRIRIPTTQEEAPLLAINRTNGTFVIAADNKLLVYKAGQPKLQSEFDVDANVAAILPTARGYLVLFTDGSIRSLDSNGSGQPKAMLSNDSTESGPESAIAMDVVATEPSHFADMLQGSIVDSNQDEVELDDRPVVRPEQLTDIFETSQSFAMLSVRDMFHAVADLYSKKPVVRVPADLE